MAEIGAQFGVFCYPIVSSGRAFRALWKRSYSRFREFLGGVVYEDPWLAGGHNGLSNSEDPQRPEAPMPRVLALRQEMRANGLDSVPIFMAGGVWYLSEWKDWIDNPDLGPIAFQFGTRPLVTQESPVSDEWKRKLLQLQEGDVFLNRFSPTGFYSSAVQNAFLRELMERNERQVAYTREPVGEHTEPLPIGARGRVVFVTSADKQHAEAWLSSGFVEALRTPDSTLIFVTSRANPPRSGSTSRRAWGAFRHAASPTGRRTKRVRPARWPTRGLTVFRRPCRPSLTMGTSSTI